MRSRGRVRVPALQSVPQACPPRSQAVRVRPSADHLVLLVPHPDPRWRTHRHTPRWVPDTRRGHRGAGEVVAGGGRPDVRGDPPAHHRRVHREGVAADRQAHAGGDHLAGVPAQAGAARAAARRRGSAATAGRPPTQRHVRGSAGARPRGRRRRAVTEECPGGACRAAQGLGRRRSMGTALEEPGRGSHSSEPAAGDGGKPPAPPCLDGLGTARVPACRGRRRPLSAVAARRNDRDAPQRGTRPPVAWR